ncbi:MAG: hypothetical protein M3357_11260, partial [Actinomycetota bacterium]|nr:hypothetical protein [Actinomycetota bacterium]
HDEAAGFLRMALGLLPAGDARRPRLLGRLGLTLAWGRAFEEALPVAAEAGDAIAGAEGPDAAAAYLADASHTCGMVAGSPHAWTLARKGLGYATRRDEAWARMVFFDLQRREAEDPEHPGIPLDTPDRWEAASILRAAPGDPMGIAALEAVFSTGSEARASRNLAIRVFMGGDFADCIDPLEAEVQRALAQGQLVRAARARSFGAFCLIALGRLREARAAINEAQAFFTRAGAPMFVALHAREQLVLAVDEGWEELAAVFEPMVIGPVTPANAWALGPIYAISGRIDARLGRAEAALRRLELLLPWLERAPAWTAHYPVMASHAADILCLLDRPDDAGLVDQMLREKVVQPDFRDAMVDGRLALARLCALGHRHDEARHWLAEARRVLTGQSARPLLAIADYDEALVEARDGNSARARALVEAARGQFGAIGMTGWMRKADELSRWLS